MTANGTVFAAIALPRWLSAAVILAALVIAPVSHHSAIAVTVSDSTGDLSYSDGHGHTMPYRLFLPGGYDPQDKYPLILFLHGADQRGSDNLGQLSGGFVDNIYAATQDARYHAFLLSPQCPTGAMWVDWPWGNGSYSDAQEPAESQAMKLVMSILGSIGDDYPSLDKSRIYVTGLSMGGYGTWDAIRRYPDFFAAAMPLSGGGNKDQGELLKDIPIWAYHGVADPYVPVSASDNMRDAIALAGGSIEYTRLDGVRHEGWNTFYDNSTYRTSGNETTYQWLFSQQIPVPEPGASTLFAFGCTGFTWLVGSRRWMKRRNKR